MFENLADADEFAIMECDRIFDDHRALDEYLETKFIPAHVLLKHQKDLSGSQIFFLSIRLDKILALQLSKLEFEYVINYLKEKNIHVNGKNIEFKDEFENYDFVTSYKENGMGSTETSRKIKIYKQNNDSALREEIIINHMAIVRYVAYKFAIINGVNNHELESYGYETLIKALENYNISSTITFPQYANLCIMKTILSEIRKNLHGKTCTYYFDYIKAIKIVERESGMMLHENLELIEDVLDLLVRTNKINETEREKARKRIMTLVIGDISLDDDNQLIDTRDYSEEVVNSVVIDNALCTLSERSREVLRLRYGLSGEQPLTQKEVGQKLGVSTSRIGQIEYKAIQSLRNPSRLRLLKGDSSYKPCHNLRK